MNDWEKAAMNDWEKAAMNDWEKNGKMLQWTTGKRLRWTTGKRLQWTTGKRLSAWTTGKGLGKGCNERLGKGCNEQLGKGCNEWLGKGMGKREITASRGKEWVTDSTCSENKPYPGVSARWQSYQFQTCFFTLKCPTHSFVGNTNLSSHRIYKHDFRHTCAANKQKTILETNLDVCSLEQDALGGQLVNVGSDHVAFSIAAKLGPEVVHHQEQHVRPWGRC